jgi:hypothetical protein
MRTSHIVKRLQEDTAYQEFFKKAMDKFGIKSIGDLQGGEKKEFFNYIEKNYKADKETNEGYMPNDSSISKEVQSKGGVIDAFLGNLSSRFKVPSQDLSKLADMIWDYADAYAESRAQDLDAERSF